MLSMVGSDSLAMLPARTALWRGVGFTPIWIFQRWEKEIKSDRGTMMRMSAFVKSLGGLLIYLPSIVNYHPNRTCGGVAFPAITSLLCAGLLRIGVSESDTLLLPWQDSLALLLATWDTNIDLDAKGSLREVKLNGRSFGLVAAVEAWRQVVRGQQQPPQDRFAREYVARLLSILNDATFCNTGALSPPFLLSSDHWASIAQHYGVRQPTLTYERMRRYLSTTPLGEMRLLDSQYGYGGREPDKVFWFVVTHHHPSTSSSSSFDRQDKISRIDACKATWLDDDVHIITRDKVVGHRADRLLPALLPGVDNLPAKRQVIKFFEVWAYLYKYKLEHYDWFIKVDDDTYLRKDYMLFDVMKATGNMGDGPLRVGELFCHPEYNSCYCTGPAYALNRAALALMGPHIEECKQAYKNLIWEDMALGLCLTRLGVPPCVARPHVVNTLNPRRKSKEEWIWYHKAEPSDQLALYQCDSYGLFG